MELIIVLILIVFTLLYFLSRLVFNKLKVGKRKNRKFLAIIPSIILSPLLSIGLILLGFSINSYYPEREFNKHSWDNEIEIRYELSNSIIETEMLLGKSKEEVIEVLGTEIFNQDENSISYYLGFVPGSMTSEPDILLIFFENGKVNKVKQSGFE